MSCRVIRPHETEYLDGVLSPSLSLRVEDHVLRCAACRERLSGTRRALEALRQQPEPQPPPELWARVMEATQEPAETGARVADSVEPLMRRLGRVLSPFKPLLASSLVALALLAALLLSPAHLWPTEEPQTMPTPEAAEMVRFAEDVHERTSRSRVTVVGSLDDGPDMQIHGMTPTRRGVKLPEPGSRQVVLMLFESISVAN